MNHQALATILRLRRHGLLAMRPWLTRIMSLCYVWLLATLAIALFQPMRGRSIGPMLLEAAGWGLLAALVFLAVRAWRRRRGEVCQLCELIIADPQLRPGSEEGGADARSTRSQGSGVDA